MKIFPHQDIDAKNAEEGASNLKVRWLITKEMGAPNFAMRLFEMEPKGHSPFHSHPWEHEVFILEGEGFVASEEGEKKFKAGDVVFILPNEKHQLKNKGERTVRFLCLVPLHK
ncbi:MAG: cupin domain-containing protein [Candidatus Bathyarchaeota archaeon]|nr:cupin domain-containing protein [Candidatus Bathyarchaeota archaeon]MDH5787602.1 cupin domain-containing protein [Candidatus Bathyarchaeota archaeon]